MKRCCLCLPAGFGFILVASSAFGQLSLSHAEYRVSSLVQIEDMGVVLEDQKVFSGTSSASSGSFSAVSMLETSDLQDRGYAAAGASWNVTSAYMSANSGASTESRMFSRNGYVAASSTLNIYFALDRTRMANFYVEGLYGAYVWKKNGSVWDQLFTGILGPESVVLDAGEYRLLLENGSVSNGVDAYSSSDNLTMSLNPVPEPGSYFALVAGMGLMKLKQRRKSLPKYLD